MHGTQLAQWVEPLPHPSPYPLFSGWVGVECLLHFCLLLVVVVQVWFIYFSYVLIVFIYN